MNPGAERESRAAIKAVYASRAIVPLLCKFRGCAMGQCPYAHERHASNAHTKIFSFGDITPWTNIRVSN
jgi:hypothetical protein